MKKGILHVVAASALLCFASTTISAQVPVYVSSVIENSTPTRLELRYNTNLANIVPPISAFNVFGFSVSNDITAVAIAGNKVVLFLRTNAVFGETITVSYTVPATNRLHSVTGEFASSITLQNVTNNVLLAGHEYGDGDNHTFGAIGIGYQRWMNQNLKVTKLNNGTPIPLVMGGTAWSGLTTPAYCYYNNDLANFNTYGALYNWYTVQTGRLCPTGWHVPANGEWVKLVRFLGDSLTAGGKLKEVGYDHWLSPNTGATNESGFTALGGALRDNTGGWSDDLGGLNYRGLWWSSSIYYDDANVAYNRIMYSDNTYAYSNASNWKYGCSVRCLQNVQPLASINGTTAVCQNATEPLITFTGIAGTAPFTFTYVINGGSNQTVSTTSGNSVMVSVPTTTAGTFTYSLLAVQDAYVTQDQSGTATVIINPLPTATISGTISVCRNAASPNVTFTGSGGIAPYTFTYNINGGSNQTVATTVGNNVTVAAPTGSAGTFTYTLVNVSDESGCFQIQSGNAIITVNPLPTATISGSIALCVNGASPNITFTGVGGTTPYTFTYNINSGNNLTISTISGNSVTLAVATITPGVFSYNLVSVQDGSSTACSQTQTGSAVVTVNALPTASISGTTTICQNSASPVITFTGANSIAPYTFTYNINGGSDLTVTTTTGNSVTVYAPTTIAGTFAYNLVSVTDASSTTCSNPQPGNAIVTVYPLSVASAIITNVSCNQCKDGAIDLTATGGTGTLTYAWTGPNGFSANIEDIVHLRPGVYNLTVTDLNSCAIGNSYEVLNQFVVTNNNNTGNGSLRDAINYANGTHTVTPDTISFNIPVTGSFTIRPITTPLPQITDPIIIDGYTQPGTSYINSTLLIELDGTNLTGGYGLALNADNCLIKGLVINSFGIGTGIDVNSKGNIIAGNFVGTDITGKIKKLNSTGIRLRGGNNKIGGNTSSERNIISGNQLGINIEDCSNNIIIGNYIGVDISGKSALGNDVMGLTISGHSGGMNNIIGGANPGERNIISANGIGIKIVSSGDIRLPANRNIVKGNYIGLDVSGKSAMGNVGDGVQIERYQSYNVIGGTNSGEGNVISGNGGAGIKIQGIYTGDDYGANNNMITGNYIGTDAYGVASMGNLIGINIYMGATGNQIGDTIQGGGNIIAFSKEQGIVVIGNGTIGNKILSNSIHSNVGLGIDLGVSGVTLNDEVVGQYDIDAGPNNLQNYPVMDSFNLDLGAKKVFVSGYLKSTASTEFTLQFFASKVGDNTGYGEGQKYLGSAKVTTDADGRATFNESFYISSSWGDVITATATDANGNTSEFSMAIGGFKDQIIPAFKWPFHFIMNEEGVPRITDGSDTAAVGKSFRTWESIPTANIDFVNDKTTTQSVAAANDGVNLVTFTDKQFPFPPRVLAIAAKTLKVSPNDDVAEIIDADIVVNPLFVAHDVGVGYGNTNEGYYDVQSIVTHEIGHVLGLLHTGVVSSTMFFMLDSGTTVRSLEQDDRSWASYKYPGTSYNSTFGSISGRITYGEDITLPPVAGALVLAINTTSNVAVHAYSDADGNYLVPGLPPGTYNIYIQPLDGNVYGYALRPGNISTYIYCNTIYTDYPGEYLSVGESNEESSDTPFEVTVTVNADSPGNNIITNKDLTPPTFKSVKPTDLLDGKIKVMSDFVLRFSEPIDVQTFNGETCYLELPIGKKFGGSYTAVPDSTHIIVFNPDSVLRYNATYTLHLTSGIKDMKGNGLIEPSAVSFTTVDRDHTPPTIASTFPVNTADSVFVTTKINVIFSEAMDIGSVNENFALTWDEGTPVVTRTVDGSFSWDNERRNLTFTPSRSLNEKTKYTITVSTGATDLSDNQLANTNSFTFTTVTEAAPQIFYLGPRNLQTGVTVETPVVADFSEPVDPLSVNSTTFSLKTTNGQIPVTGTFEFLNGNTRVVFRPDVNLEFSTGYTILLTTGIKDVSETVRNLEADRTSVFTTASAIVSPSITYLYPPRGKAGWAVTISGTGFDPIPDKNLISFNGITAYTETASLNTLTTKVPANTLSGSVSVTVNGRTSNLKQFDIIPDYGNDPIDYVVSSKSLGSYPSGGADIGGSGEAVFALVTNPDGNYVTRIGLGTQAGGITTIPVGLYPRNVDIDPQGRRAYVTNSASHDVSVIDLTRNIVVKTIPVGVEPYDVAVMPDGKRVYVSNYVSGNLSMIDEDPTSGGFDHAVANVPMGTDPTGVVGTGDAGMVLVVGEFGLKIVNSDPKNDNYNSVVASVNTGTTYGGVDVTGDAGFAIVYTLDGYLLVINLHPENDDYSGAVVASVKIGSDLSGVKSDANGIYVYLTDTNNNQILVYKFSGGGTGSPSGSSAQGITLMPLAPIPVPYAPVGFAKSQSGDKIYTVTSVSSSPTSFRQVTSVSPSGLKISPESTIEGLISTIQILINNGIIKQAQGNELIKKLNDALKNLANNKTKNAINDLNAFINKVKAQVPKAQGQPIIDATNAIIKQLQGIKSDEEETNFTDIGTQSDQDVITQTKFGVIYPNPSRDAITINYEVAADELNSGKVMIKVYDVIGRVVSNLVNSTQEPGRYSVTWSATSEDGNQVSRGVYFIRLKAGNVEEVRQIMLVR